ncbi:MAG: hypothetical protein ACOCQ7_03600 [Natronomonas sp.]
MASYSSGTPSSVVVSRDGVTVEKTFGSDDFPIPTITFVIRSDRTEPVDVRFVDPVPDDVALEGVGFHPRFGSEHWSIEGEDIAFERSMDPEDEFTTVYGLRGKDVVEPERLMSEPLIERVDPSYADSAEARFMESDNEGSATEGGPTETAVTDSGSVEETERIEPAPSSVHRDTDMSVTDASSDESVVPGADKPSFAADAVRSRDADRVAETDSTDGVPGARSDAASDSDTEPIESGASTPETSKDGEDEDASDATEADAVDDGAGDDVPDLTDPVEDEGDSDTIESDDTSDADHDTESMTSGAMPASDGSQDGVESGVETGSDEPPDEASTDSSDGDRTGREEEIELVDPVDRPSVVDGNGSNTVAAVLAREIRDGAVDDRDLETIQSALVMPVDAGSESGEPTGSVDARVKHLQTRIADFDAYVDALEEFLDENGDAQTLLSDLRTDIRELDGRILSVEDRIDEVETATHERLEEATGEIDTEFDALWEDLDIAQSAIADLEAENETLEDTVGEFADAIEAVDELEREFDAVAEDVGRIDEQLAELSAMREQLNRVFGGTDAEDV